MERWIIKLFYKKFYYCLYLFVLYKLFNLKIVLFCVDIVFFLLKRYRGEEFYGFFFICNIEFKIYKYRVYGLNSVYVVIYLEKMNFNKKL